MTDERNPTFTTDDLGSGSIMQGKKANPKRCLPLETINLFMKKESMKLAKESILYNGYFMTVKDLQG